MQLISAQTLSSASASVTFSSIPQTFTDLKCVMSVRTTNSATNGSVLVGFNGTSNSTNWSIRYLEGSGASASSGTGTSGVVGYPPAANATASTFGNLEVYVPNYTASVNKSLSVDSVMENNATTAYADLIAGLWSNTAAISSIEITPGSGNFAIGSSFYLYGISSDTANQNTSSPYAWGGDIVKTDGTYWYHTFLNSNSFVPQINLTCDVLVVAGGGGGGWFYGGGGGAGGYRYFTSQSLTAGTSYPALVGAGGPGCTTNGDVSAFKGSNSTFNSISATGGGAGNGIYGENGAAGGSGGGGGAMYNGEPVGGLGGAGNQGGYTPVEGYAGANGGTNNSTRLGGGGGGSSAVGNTTTGGAGTANSISGTSVTYAAGGSGNASRYAAPAAAGAAGTGNGGGGSGEGQGNGTAGGSGVIILRYAV